MAKLWSFVGLGGAKQTSSTGKAHLCDLRGGASYDQVQSLPSARESTRAHGQAGQHHQAHSRTVRCFLGGFSLMLEFLMVAVCTRSASVCGGRSCICRTAAVPATRRDAPRCSPSSFPFLSFPPLAALTSRAAIWARWPTWRGRRCIRRCWRRAPPTPSASGTSPPGTHQVSGC